MSKKILIGVAWPYVNGDIHVGHLAGYLLPADVMARYHRLRGNDVLMVSGSDCHGTPITVEADKQGVNPADIVDKYHRNDIELFKQYNLSYNLYTTTTTENHKRVVQQMFLDLIEHNYIVKDTMKQYYSAEDKEFLPDRYVEGTCPHCGAKEQRSDQCENCGRWLEDGELIDPYSKKTGAKVELKDTEHYFLDFQKLEPELKEYVQSKARIWRNWIYQETDGWLKEGMRKRAITRDMDWAIELPVEKLKKLPEEKQLKSFEGKRIYVWFEAVIGYLSAPQEWSNLEAETEGLIFSKTKGQSSDWKDWWLNEDAVIYNFMGQDNLVFHTLMWPGQLLGSKRGYTLPHNVIVNKFMNYEGKKFSKSRNWTIDSKKIADKYGVDLVRYYIAANFPENKEANFTWEGFVDAVNNELVANLGNFVNRTLKFLESKFEGKLSKNEIDFEEIDKIRKKIQDEESTRLNKLRQQEVTEKIDKYIPLMSENKQYLLFDEYLNKTDDLIKSTYLNTGQMLDSGEQSLALNAILQLTRFGNQFFNDSEIWNLIKEDENLSKFILWKLLQIVANLPGLLSPYIPSSSEQLAKLLGLSIEIEVGKNNWVYNEIENIELTKRVVPIFPKLDKAVVLEEKEN